MTVEVKNKLSLPVVGKDKLLIKTFGDESPKLRNCEIVQYAVCCKNGEAIVMQAYVVPVICTPISNLVLSQSNCIIAVIIIIILRQKVVASFHLN